MAKSIEQKVVDAIVGGMDNRTFRYPEFSRIMATETLPRQHFDFMALCMGYMNYLATFSSYGYYPNNLLNECLLAEKVAPIMNDFMQELAEQEANML